MHAALLWFRVAISFIWRLNQVQNFTLNLRIERLTQHDNKTVGCKLYVVYSLWCVWACVGVCVCCLTLLHVLSGPTEPPHPTSPITQSPPPLSHKGTSALPVSPPPPPPPQISTHIQYPTKTKVLNLKLGYVWAAGVSGFSSDNFIFVCFFFFEILS